MSDYTLKILSDIFGVLSISILLLVRGVPIEWIERLDNLFARYFLEASHQVKRVSSRLGFFGFAYIFCFLIVSVAAINHYVNRDFFELNQTLIFVSAIFLPISGVLFTVFLSKKDKGYLQFSFLSLLFCFVFLYFSRPFPEPDFVSALLDAFLLVFYLRLWEYVVFFVIKFVIMPLVFVLFVSWFFIPYLLYLKKHGQNWMLTLSALLAFIAILIRAYLHLYI